MGCRFESCLSFKIKLNQMAKQTEELAVAAPQEFTPKQVKDLQGNLPQILKEREALEKQFDEVTRMDITSKETQETASALRKLILKNRTQGIEKWHTATKNYFLRGGQFVDAMKRKEIEVSKRMEDMLLEIENYEANLKAKALAELKEKRSAQLGTLIQYVPMGVTIETMTDVEFGHLEHMCKNIAEAEATKAKAETDRLKAEQDELKRLRAIAAEKEKEEKKAKAEEAKLNKMSDADRLMFWVNGFSINSSPVDSPEAKEITLKFIAFKKWALNQIK